MMAPEDTSRLRRWLGWCDRSAGLTALAALLLTVVLLPVPGTWPLLPVALALLFNRLVVAERPARLAWLFGLVHQLTLLHWLFLLVPAKSIPTRALVPVQALAAIGYVSVFYLLLGWVFGQVRRRWGATRALLLLPALWTAMEALRSLGELAFPWCLSGAGLLFSPLAGLARTCGELGLSAGLAFTGAVLAALALRLGPGLNGRLSRSQFGLLLGATVVVWAGLGLGSAWRPASPPAAADEPDDRRTAPLSVAVIQANVDLADKWVDAKLDSTRLPYGNLTRRAAGDGAELVVWAETAIPAYVRYDKALLGWTRALVRETGVYLFTGFPDADRSADGGLLKYNASGLFDRRGELVGRYAKSHLLPIGEAMPFTSVLPFLARIDVGQAEWTPGDPPRPLVMRTDAGDFSFACLICFESVFGGLARDAVRSGAQALAVITNDGWFGESAGPAQHTYLARLRAIECGVPVLRCANNGISFVCDDHGVLLGELGLGQRGLVQATITPGRRDTAYLRFGTRPLLVFLLFWTVLAIWRGGSTPAGLPGKEI